MKKSLRIILALTAFCAGCIWPLGTAGAVVVQSELGVPLDPDPGRAERMAWWRDARYGMFIHWGLYSQLAGNWKGKNANTVGEWIMNYFQIPREEYAKIAESFNPDQFKAADWVSLAKKSGMKYLVITSKHHDGFCIYDTKQTDYNIVKATPFKRDPIKELSEECKKQGVAFGIYYSILDWHHPTQYESSKPGRQYDSVVLKGENKTKYVAFMKAQLKELVQQYNPEILWFDGDWFNWWTKEDGQDLAAYLHGLKPSLIVNDRVRRGRGVGDYLTPEGHIPNQGPQDDWESCMTMNGTWGFKGHGGWWMPAQDIIRGLANTASKGGNLLLNVGPDGKGVIPQGSVNNLLEAGKWLDANGEAIYGTSRSPLAETPPGVFVTSKGDALYAIVFKWPENGVLTLKGLPRPAQSVSLLGEKTNASVNVVSEGTTATITLPAKKANAIADVFKLELSRKGAMLPITEQDKLIAQRAGGVIHGN